MQLLQLFFGSNNLNSLLHLFLSFTILFEQNKVHCANYEVQAVIE